jgi:hypothetical protein
MAATCRHSIHRCAQNSRKHSSVARQIIHRRCLLRRGFDCCIAKPSCQLIMFAAVCLCCCADCVASVLKVEGASMRPTLNPDSTGPSDWVLVEKLSVKLQRCYTRGEVVVLW